MIINAALFQCGVLLYNRAVVNIKNKEVLMRLLITGGAGFIGSNYINWHLQQYPNDEIVCLDKLTYAASKAAADLLCLAYARTYGLYVTISRSSNNYGPWQHSEKLLPKIIALAESGKKIPVYGTGLNKRDWLYVLDHCIAVDKILKNGKAGHIYNIAAGTEMANLTFIKVVLGILGKDENVIEFVKDRAGHDLRYPMDCEKIKNELAWKPHYAFEEALTKTVAWYKG